MKNLLHTYKDFVELLQQSLPAGSLVTDPQKIRIIAARHRHPFSTECTPFAIVLPDCERDVAKTLALADTYRIPVFTRGKGTGLGDLSTITSTGILLLTDRLNRIRMINQIGHYAVVEAGVVNAEINRQVQRFNLYYPPDPASFERSSIGGNVATNAGGYHCTKYGVTRDSLLSLTVVLPDGRIVETGRPTMKNVAGFDLTSLFTGSEGLLGIITTATVKLRPIPQEEDRIIAFLDNLKQAGKAITEVLRTPVQPASLELMSVPYERTYPKKYVSAVGSARWMLVATVDGSGATHDADIIYNALAKTGASLIRPTAEEVDSFFLLRKTGRAFPRGSSASWMAGSDVAVPLDKLADFLIELETIATESKAQLTIMAHAADGNTHTGFILPKRNDGERFPDVLKQAMDRLYAYVLDNGGTITGEHGIGLELKTRLVDQIGGDNLALQKSIKSSIDPHNILNPGKWV